MFDKVIEQILTRKADAPGDHVNVEPLTGQPSTLSFVDGGNAPIFTSPAARVELIRIARVTSNGSKLSHEVREGILLLTATEGGVHASSSELKIDEHLLTTSLEEAATWCRFMLECAYDGFTIRDGPLIGKSRVEVAALRALDGAGLSKTSEQLSVLPETPGTWLARIGEEQGVTISIVKLHERAKYRFRLDTRGDPHPVATQLVSHSSDPGFLGYPYPLVVADRLARINALELRTLRARLEAEAGERWEELRSRERYTDAHDLLDRLNRKI